MAVRPKLRLKNGTPHAIGCCHGDLVHHYYMLHIMVWRCEFWILCDSSQFRTYTVNSVRGGCPLPIILCDTMGLEESTGAGLNMDDIISILKGHLPDLYQVELSVTFSRIPNERLCADFFSPPCTINSSTVVQFDPAIPLNADSRSYKKYPGIEDKIHCVAYVVDAYEASIMPAKLEEKLGAIRRKVNELSQ